MATNRPFRLGVHYLARGLFFVGFTVLFAGGSLVDIQENRADLWWLLGAGIVVALGGTAQRFSTPTPLQPVTTSPPGFVWSMFIAITFPWVLRGFDWHDLWLIVPVLIAVTMGVWASLLPVHRQQSYNSNTRERCWDTCHRYWH